MIPRTLDNSENDHEKNTRVEQCSSSRSPKHFYRRPTPAISALSLLEKTAASAVIRALVDASD